MKVTKLQALSTLQTGSSRPRGRKKIEGVTSQTTVQKLKMLICEDLDLLPSEQELHYQDSTCITLLLEYNANLILSYPRGS